MTNILHISYDGLLGHLGYSQVIRYVRRLAERGFNYSMLSLERPADLENRRRVRELNAELSASGIDWHPIPYADGSSAADAASNVARGTTRALSLVRDHDIDLVHARSYIPASMAHVVRRLLGTPYLFDIRGYWIDERLADGRWFTNPVVEAGARQLERRLYQHASGVVALTDVAGRDIQSGRFGPWSDSRPVVVIPTCADYDDFQRRRSGVDLPPSIARLSEGEQLVVGYVGSVKSAYYVDASLQLFERLLQRRGDAHLLCATAQTDKMRRRIAAHNLPPQATTVVSVPHRMMPAVLEVIDWGFLLVECTEPRRAMMPTKLAEFFAADVRPIHYGCNRDVEHWVDRAGSGISLDAITPRRLDQTAAAIADTTVDQRLLRRARRITRPHFGLDAGVDAYAALCDRLTA